MITNSLRVILWEHEIGRLSWEDRRDMAYFEYNKDFLQGNLDVFPLIAPISSPISRLPILGDKEKKIYHKLPPFMADSLPDAWGNQVFECWRIQNNIKDHAISPLDLLSFIGRRGMGALEFIPESSGITHSEQLNLKKLTVLAQRIFVEREKVRIMPDESLTMQALIAVGTSAGGRQPKAIIAIHPETGEIRSGQIAGQEGFEYYLLKFGDAERSSAELEMAYYEMARAAGIEMMPCRLIEVEGQQHFITRRFDRDGNRKLHMQTLAALYPEADSYEKLLMVCRKMRLPESTQEEVFRRMVFNLLANNTDDHNKNFSFLMDEKGNWRLSPAYDLTYIFNTAGFLPETTHCLMLRGKFSGHTKEDVLAVAKENGIRKAEQIIQEVVDAVSRFQTFATKHGVQNRWISAVESTLNDHLAAWGYGPSKEDVSFTAEGHAVSQVRVEQTYKGNYHLYATIDGSARRFIITKSKPEFTLLEQQGAAHIPAHQLRQWVLKYFLNNNLAAS